MILHPSQVATYLPRYLAKEAPSCAQDQRFLHQPGCHNHQTGGGRETLWYYPVIKVSYVNRIPFAFMRTNLQEP